MSVQNIRGNRKGKWDETGVIVEAMPNGRDYAVQKDLGGRPTLNRRYLRALADVESPTAPLDPDGGTAAAPPLAGDMGEPWLLRRASDGASVSHAPCLARLHTLARPLHRLGDP